MVRDLFLLIVVVAGLTGGSLPADDASQLETDLLIVGGTESGCAAALQAARMGVQSITIVNDIEWLGGQFSAEALVAIDENRGPEGYGHGVPFPRSGIFKEVIDEIERINTEKHGVPRPGNTRVITTCLPEDAEQVFRNLLEPYLQSGRIVLKSNFAPVEVITADRGQRVSGVRFQHVQQPSTELTVHAKLTIDASDWGDVIRFSGAAYEFGPDLKSHYGEPLAPESRDDYPVTDMNPITYCMVLTESESDTIISEPALFDRRNYDGLSYPSDPSWIYASRRIVDRHHFQQIRSPEAVLLCFPAFDYPLDRFTQSVVDQLEATEKGASVKNIVEMTRQQREIVFADAKQRSLGYLYYLQTIAHGKASDPQKTFRKLKLTEAFGTADRLPPKPYVRESLRLRSQYQLKQQDTTGVGGIATNYAVSMVHDPIACWQFEYDFHPTKRQFLTGDPAGPWHPAFRKNRTWGPPYSGKAQFSLRSLVPEAMDGLLGAQKNLGYSSIVSSAVRLHDQSVAIGQGCGAVAAISLLNEIAPRDLTWHAELLAAIWEGLLTAGTVPQTLWPFGDLDPTHPDFVAINQLAVRQLFPLGPHEVEFKPDQPASPEWRQQVLDHVKNKRHLDALPEFEVTATTTRGEFASQLWEWFEKLPVQEYVRLDSRDADQDGIPDHEDPLLFVEGRSTFGDWTPPPETDGLPAADLLQDAEAKRINFGGNQTEDGTFMVDLGQPFDLQRGFGWGRSLSANRRIRNRFGADPRDTFLFTRSHDQWNLELPNGRYRVTACVGDAGHAQFGQNVTIEGVSVWRNLSTESGQFAEQQVDVIVKDGQLTVEIGLENSTTNTCLNWLIIQRL